MKFHQTPLDEKDILLVMSQAGCLKTKATFALLHNEGDIINAILACSY